MDSECNDCFGLPVFQLPLEILAKTCPSYLKGGHLVVGGSTFYKVCINSFLKDYFLRFL